MEVFGTLDFRTEDGMQPVLCLLDYLDEVRVEIRGVEGVYAVEGRPTLPVELCE